MPVYYFSGPEDAVITYYAIVEAENAEDARAKLRSNIVTFAGSRGAGDVDVTVSVNPDAVSLNAVAMIDECGAVPAAGGTDA